MARNRFGVFFTSCVRFISLSTGTEVFWRDVITLRRTTSMVFAMSMAEAPNHCALKPTLKHRQNITIISVDDKSFANDWPNDQHSANREKPTTLMLSIGHVASRKRPVHIYEIMLMMRRTKRGTVQIFKKREGGDSFYGKV